MSATTDVCTVCGDTRERIEFYGDECRGPDENWDISPLGSGPPPVVGAHVYVAVADHNPRMSLALVREIARAS